MAGEVGSRPDSETAVYARQLVNPVVTGDILIGCLVFGTQPDLPIQTEPGRKVVLFPSFNLASGLRVIREDLHLSIGHQARRCADADQGEHTKMQFGTG